MTVTLNKEIIQSCDVVYQKYNRTTVETDVNVPDINPDILKVLDVSGYVTVSDKSIRAGKAYIQGTVHMTVLYAPEGDVVSKVKSLSASAEFTHTADIGNVDDNVQLVAETEPESFNYTLINSRKISLRCVLGIDVKLSRTEEFEIASSAESDSNLCTQCQKVRIFSNSINSENRIALCEQFEIPSDKPSIGEILKTDVLPESLEFSLMENEASAKGQVKICTMYISADDGSVCHVEHTIPFSEVLDVLGAEEDMEGEIDYSLSDLYCEVRDDSDGEPRIIGLDLGLGTNIRGHKIYEPDIISDAYALHGTANITSENKQIEQLTDNITAQFTHKASVNIPEIYPDISELCTASATASVNSITAGDGEITVNGNIQSTILYLTGDDAIPLCSFTDTSEFTHTLSAPNVNKNAVCEAKIFIEHISYTMNGTSAVDLRVVLGLCVRAFVNEEIPVICDIEIDEDTDNTPDACIIIYFAKQGDTLWNIAKMYHTTVDALKECNNLNSDTINVGQQIRICRTA